MTAWSQNSSIAITVGKLNYETFDSVLQTRSSHFTLITLFCLFWWKSWRQKSFVSHTLWSIISQNKVNAFSRETSICIWFASNQLIFLLPCCIKFKFPLSSTAHWLRKKLHLIDGFVLTTPKWKFESLPQLFCGKVWRRNCGVEETEVHKRQYFLAFVTGNRLGLLIKLWKRNMF